MGKTGWGDSPGIGKTPGSSPFVPFHRGGGDFLSERSPSFRGLLVGKIGRHRGDPKWGRIGLREKNRLGVGPGIGRITNIKQKRFLR